MPVSGLVVTLAADPALRERAFAAILGCHGVTLGEAMGARLPVVTETETMSEHEALWRRLEAIDGVLQVRLAFHDFSDVDPPGAHARRPRGG